MHEILNEGSHKRRNICEMRHKKLRKHPIPCQTSVYCGNFDFYYYDRFECVSHRCSAARVERERNLFNEMSNVDWIQRMAWSMCFFANHFIFKLKLSGIRLKSFCYVYAIVPCSMFLVLNVLFVRRVLKRRGRPNGLIVKEKRKQRLSMIVSTVALTCFFFISTTPVVISGNNNWKIN